MKNLFEICSKMYEMSWFGQKFKRSSGTETGKIEEKHLQTDEFVEHSRNSRKTGEKLQFGDQKLKIKDKTAKTEKIRGIRV